MDESVDRFVDAFGKKKSSKPSDTHEVISPLTQVNRVCAANEENAKVVSQVQTVVLNPEDFFTYAPSRVSEDVVIAAGLAYRATKGSYVDLATNRPIRLPDAILRLKAADRRQQQTVTQ